MATAQANEIEANADEWTKPPFLRRVRIRGYKSIAFCDVALQPLTILVGPNASGKSNFLDALAFLRDVLEKGTVEAVRLHGGRKAILPRSAPGTTVSISVEAEFQKQVTRAACFANYGVEVKLPARSKPVVLTEAVRIKSGTNGSETGFDRKNEDVKWLGFPDAKSSPQIPWCPADRSMLRLYGETPLLELWEGIGGIGVYNFSPGAIRDYQVPAPGQMLERDGHNLASVIESVREISEDTINRVQAYLSVIVSELQAIRVVHYGEKETVRFLIGSGNGRKPLEFDAASMSDGTLRALAALIAAFQIQLPFGPSVVGIEEPETALHPAAMGALVDALDEATSQTQVLLTTHSADLLDDRDLRPSQVLVVRNHNGQTQITPVDVASREIIAKDLSSLADLHRQDHLDLDEADLQRQSAIRAGMGGA
jgi:predicted ATPase